MHIPHIVSIADPLLLAKLNTAIDNKTKPRGSLGMLEDLARQAGLVQQTTHPSIVDPAILVFAADHGVVAENVSLFPQDVTWQMVENFLAEGAGINVFARQNKLALQVVDAGVKHDFGVRAGLTDRKVGSGTANFAEAPAMTTAQCEQALQHGMDLAAACPGNVIGFGEMGIGNTTAAAALMHKFTRLPVAQCVGAGTGLTSTGVQHKQNVIEQAVALHAATTPLEILATFGGFEIAMMAGAMLKAAELRKILLVDGFIVSSALLAASALQPAVLEYCVFSHCSDESGHRKMLGYMDARPLLNLNLRLGEGTGSALAFPLLVSAVNFLAEMATFDSAAVSDQKA